MVGEKKIVIEKSMFDSEYAGYKKLHTKIVVRMQTDKKK